MDSREPEATPPRRRGRKPQDPVAGAMDAGTRSRRYRDRRHAETLKLATAYIAVCEHLFRTKGDSARFFIDAAALKLARGLTGREG